MPAASGSLSSVVGTNTGCPPFTSAMHTACRASGQPTPVSGTNACPIRAFRRLFSSTISLNASLSSFVTVLPATISSFTVLLISHSLIFQF